MCIAGFIIKINTQRRITWKTVQPYSFYFQRHIRTCFVLAVLLKSSLTVQWSREQFSLNFFKFVDFGFLFGVYIQSHPWFSSQCIACLWRVLSSWWTVISFDLKPVLCIAKDGFIHGDWATVLNFYSNRWPFSYAYIWLKFVTQPKAWLWDLWTSSFTESGIIG